MCHWGWVETLPTIYFPPSHRTSQHPPHQNVQMAMFRSSIASQAAF